MAYCPKCKAEMSATEIVCPGCGFDFPGGTTGSPSGKSGIAHSPLADIALMISTFAGSIACLIAIGFSLISLSTGQFFNGLGLGPIAFFLQLGMVVVFLRVQED